MFKSIMKKINQARSRRSTRNELYSLSDNELSDIGISRHDIPRIVREYQ